MLDAEVGAGLKSMHRSKICVVGCSFYNDLTFSTYAPGGMDAHLGHNLLGASDVCDVYDGLDSFKELDGLEVLNGLEVYDQLLLNRLADLLGMELLEL